MHTQWVSLSDTAEGRDGSPHLRGYFVRPDIEGPLPGVVVLQEAFEIDAVLRRQAERMAAAGYLVLLPDLFSEGGARRCLFATMRALRAGRGRPFTDIETARRWLELRDDCTGRVGSLGFCMGGGFALATLHQGFGAAAPNYGMPPKDLDAAVRGACPVVGSYGGRDRVLKGAAHRLDAALERAGVPHDVKEYPDAGHSFLSDEQNAPRWLRPLAPILGMGPHPESAADAWARIEAFFAEHLHGSEPGARAAEGPDRGSDG